MPRFKYRAMDRRGKTQEGVITAANMASLSLLLKTQGQFLVSAAPAPVEKAAPAAARPGTAPVKLRRGSIKLEDVIIFNNQLTLMVRSAVPILDAISNLASQQTNAAFRAALFDICDNVKEGQSLTYAFSRHPLIFDKIYLSLLEAGEAGGTLAGMLERITSYLNFSDSIRSRLRAALVYPSVVMGAAFLIVILLLIFVLPTFAVVFAQFNAPLPLITRILLWVSASLRSRWYLYIAAGAGAYFYVRFRLRDPKLAASRDRALVTLPVIGPLVRAIILARSLRTLGELLRGSVPILKAIRLAQEAAGNVVFAAAYEEMWKNVSAGQGVAPALATCEYIPEMVPHLVLTAEKSGRLSEALLFVSDYYEHQVDAAIKNLFAAIEPMFVVFLGAMIGTMAIAMLLPIFQLGGLVG